MTKFLAKIFSGNPDRDRLYTNLSSPLKLRRAENREAKNEKDAKESVQRK